MPCLRFELTHKDATLPKPGPNPGDIGLDLAACEETVIPAHTYGIVKTGLRFKGYCHDSGVFETDYYLRIAPRSGLAAKKGIDVFAGVVDRGYRGEIGVILMNNGSSDFEVGVGDRVAQIIVERASFATAEVFDQENMVDPESQEEGGRGEKGFGSSG